VIHIVVAMSRFTSRGRGELYLKKKPGFIRAFAISFYAILLSAVIVSTFTVSALIFGDSGRMSDRLGELADVLTASALVIAIIAALIALQTFVVSTGSPDLELQAAFYLSLANGPIFRSVVDGAGDINTAGPSRQTDLIVSIRNKSPYGARNALLTITLAEMSCGTCDDDYPHGEQWAVVAATDEVGRFSGMMQWSQTPLIHGRSTRVLPTLHLGRLGYSPGWGQARLRLQILADGYLKEAEVPVVFWAQDSEALDSVEKPREWL
jgi:hypothetical protein